MTRQDIRRSLEKATEKHQGLITATEFAGFINKKSVSYIKKKFLSGLECIDGKYYLISDVVDMLNSRKTKEDT